jgi:WD40 repeat protein
MININRAAELLGHNSPIYALSGYLDNTVLSVGGDGWLVQWSLENLKADGQLLARVDAQIFALALMAQQKKAVVGCMLGGLYWLDLADGRLEQRVMAHDGGVYGLAVLGDNLFSTGADGRLSRWSIKTQQRAESFQLSHQGLRALLPIPDTNLLWVGGKDGHIYIVDSETFSLVDTIKNAHEGTVFSLHYDTQNKRVWSGGRDAFLRIWSPDTLQLLGEQPAHLFTLNAFAQSPDGQYIATSSRDKTIKIWRAADSELLKVVDTIRYGAHTHSINSLYWSPSGALVSASDDRRIMVWAVDFQ